MNSLPDLIAALASMATGLTFFLGFIPLDKAPSRFFSLHSMIASILWMAVLAENQNPVFFILAAACGFAWHNFRIEKPVMGKRFLALASGFSVAFALFHSGVIPFPPLLPPAWNYLWALSTLLSAALLGSCYLALMVGSDFSRGASIGQDVFARCLRIFLGTITLRAILFLAASGAIWLEWDGSALRRQWFDFSQMGLLVLSRIFFGLAIPAAITIWGLARLKTSQSFKLAPFYVVIFLILWGEKCFLRLGF